MWSFLFIQNVKKKEAIALKQYLNTEYKILKRKQTYGKISPNAGNFLESSRKGL